MRPRALLYFLLAVPALAFADSAPRRSSRDTTPTNVLPPLPDSVYSQIGWVPVLHIARLSCNTRSALGCFDGNSMVIAIRDSVPLNLQWQALEHEKIHLLLWLSGASLGEREDQIADIIASHRVGEMLAVTRK